MKKWRQVLFLICGVATMGNALNAADLTLEHCSGNLFQYKVDGKNHGMPSPALEVRDGKRDHALIPLGKPVIEKNDKGFSATWQTEKPAMKIKFILEKDRKYLRSTVKVQNRSDEQLFLNVRQQLPLPDGQLQYWNGQKNYKRVLRDYINKELYRSFPMGCAYNKNFGVAIGLEPMLIMNHIENGISIKNKNLFYGTQLVLDAKQKNQTGFVAYTFIPDYQYKNAVLEYQRYKPEVFRPADGIDPRISTTPPVVNSTYHGMMAYRKEYSSEYFRRQAGGGAWIWGYAPFMCPGDWWMRRERYENPDMHLTKVIYPFDYFHSQRKKAITASEKADSAFLFYITSYCDQKLAEHCYRDLWISDKSTQNLIPGWILSPGCTYRMFTYGNEFAEDTLNDMKKIAKHLDVRGFSFDCAAGMGIAREQKGVDKVSGRAYDNKGAYAREAVGFAMLMDETHKMFNADGIRMGVSGGCAGRRSLYYIVFRSDNGVTDSYFSEGFTAPEEQEILRFMAGTKSYNIFSWMDTENFGASLPWQSYSKEKIKKFYDSIRDNYLLFCFRYAYYFQVSNDWGCEKMTYYVPILREFIGAGYQTIPALRGADRFWHARYGTDLDTLIYIGNQRRGVRKLKCLVDNPYLGDGNYAFAGYQGKNLESRFEKGRTAISADLKEKELFLIRPAAKFSGKELSGMSVSASFTADIAGGKAVVKYKADKPYSGKVTFRLPQDTVPVEITLNGKSVARNSAVYDLKNSAAGELVFTWKSSLFKLTEKQLLDYPFVQLNTSPVKTADVVIPADPANHTLLAGERFAEYFPFFYERTQKRTDIKVRLLKGAASAVPCVILQDNAGKNSEKVFIDQDGRLVISASSPKRLFDLTTKVMLILDKKYWYYGVLGETTTFFNPNKPTQQMRKKGGIGIGDKWPGIE